MNKRTITYFTLLSIFIIGFSVLFFSNYVFPWQKKNAIETTLIWSGISKLPVNDHDISVSKKGSIFTRQFILEFETSTSNIEDWIKSDIVFQYIVPIQKNDLKIYSIYPGKEGSFGGTITIQNNKVLINMSWS